MTIYLKRHWPLLSGRALMIASAILGLFWVSMDVTPAPLSSPMGMRAAVSVQVNMISAATSTTAPKATVSEPLAEKSPAPEPLPAIANKPAAPAPNDKEIVQTIEEKPALKPTNTTELSETSTDDKTIAEVQEQEVVQQVTENEQDSEPQNAVASNNQAAGAHQEPVFVEPLFAAPPTPPRYPTIARKRGQQGVVWVDVWLDEHGQQTQTTVSQSSGLNSLDESALAAVGNWRFKPHQINGLAIASRVRIPIEFSLQ
ncbi:protein TonB [Neiella marina]|uniref:Protein TonB n=1 Tax=Neiella marina TaxID=508461 RepID=A0A8J2U3A4_9GAMM|nr:energy transducer TonB [Neiella marina]GGA69612.1 protein TonB [Neiella marina]